MRRAITHNVFHPTLISGCKLWWEGDFLAGDGNEVSADGTNYVYDVIPNRGSLGGDFTSDGDDASRPVVTYLESGGAPRRVPYFLDGYQISSLDASDWAFLHQEFTLTLVTFCADTSTLLSTFPNDADEIGLDITIRKDIHGSDILVRVGNGSGTKVIDLGDTITEFTDNVLHVSSVRMNSSGFDVRIDKEVVLEGGLADTPSGSAPYDTLNIARRAGGTQPFTGNLIAAIAYDGYLTLEQLEQVENHFISKYGHQSAPVLQKPTLYHNLNLAPYSLHVDIDNAEAGLQADRLIDFSGNGHDAVQSTDNKQGTIGTDSDSNREIQIDGTADCYGVAEGSGWPAGTSHSFWAEIDFVSTGNQQMFFDVQSGRIILLPADTSEKVGFYEGSNRPVADVVAGEQSLEWHLNSTADTGEIYRTGVYLGVNTYGENRVISGGVGLFARYTLDSYFCAGGVQEFWARDSLQSNEEIFESRKYRASKYPTRWANTLPLVVPVDVDGYTGAWFDTSDVANFVTTGTYTGTELLTNGDFETGGTPPAGWTQQSGGIGTQEAGTRTGGSGSYVGRVEAIVGDTLGLLSQSIMTAGRTYHIVAWAHGDGYAGTPRMRDGNGYVIWTGTTSTDWQLCEVNFTTASALLFVETVGDATQNFTYWDDISVKEYERIIVAKDSSRQIDDPVTNGTFNTDTTGWTAGNGATLEAVAVDPYEGAKNLKVSRSGAYGTANQDAATVGQRAMLSAYVRSDGVGGTGRLYLGGGYGDNITDTSWAHHVFVYTPTNTAVALYKLDVGAATYVEYDAVTLTPGNHGYQETEESRPVYDSVNKCMTFMAANSENLSSGIIVAPPGFTVTAWVKIPSIAGKFGRIFGSRDGTVDRAYVAVWSDGTILAAAGSAAGNAANSSVTALTDDTWAFVAVTMTPTESIIYINGGAGKSSGAYTETLSTAEAFWGAENNNGGGIVTGSYLDGHLSDPQYRPYVCTAAEIAYLYGLGRTP